MDENPYKSPAVADEWPQQSWLHSLAAHFGIHLRARLAKCSFCGDSWARNRPLVEGVRRVYICKRCVDQCATLLDAEIRKRS